MDCNTRTLASESWFEAARATKPEELGQLIDIDIQLTEEDRTRAGMHSIINICTVLYAELALISVQIGDGHMLSECMQEIYAMGQSMGKRDKALQLLANIDTLAEDVLGCIDREMERTRFEVEQDKLVQSRENVVSVFAIFSVRAQELLEREEVGSSWVEHSVPQLVQNMGDVLKAIATNSKGRYGIVYNIALQKERDYLIDLEVDSIDGDVIRMPPVLQDVLRDLTANARKYTQPGGRISVGLADDGVYLHLVVEDTGCGILDDEIKDVVRWGVRGSNVREVQVNGGGFGLTKAYMTVLEYGGRMWIKSQLGKGTRITIIIPTA